MLLTRIAAPAAAADLFLIISDSSFLSCAENYPSDCGWGADRTPGDFELRRREDRKTVSNIFSAMKVGMLVLLSQVD
jgi:hypothetical protein